MSITTVLNNTSPAVVPTGWTAYSHSDIWSGTDKLGGEQKVARREQIIGFLIEQVRAGKAGFPYQQFFRADVPTIADNIRAAKIVNITTDEEAAVTDEGYGRTIFVVHGAFQLKSYYPKWRSFGGTSPSYLNPHTGHDEPTVILSPQSSYRNMDVISDLFQEPIRMTGKRFDNTMLIGNQQYEQVSVAECWNNDICIRERIFRPALDNLREGTLLDARYLREIIYQNIPETRAFNVSWCKALLNQTLGEDLSGKSWLDISAGWGDRLIAAAINKMHYRAADPNTLLQPGYQRIISMLGDPKLQQVDPVGFEDLVLGEELFDVVLSSPPYFNLEIYNTSEDTQSITRYPGRTSWLVNFLFGVLEKAWKHLRVGGYLILHLGDNVEIPLSEEANLFIETYLEGSSWQGVLGVKNKEVLDSVSNAIVGGYARPTWVWQKRAPKVSVRHWEPLVEDINPHTGPLAWRQRSLYRCYPSTYSAYLDVLVTRYAPAYGKVKLPLLEQVYAGLAMQGIDRDTINRNISPLLMWLTIQQHLQERKLNVSEAITDVQQMLQASSTELDEIIQQRFPRYLVWKTSLTYLYQKVQEEVPTVNITTIKNMISNDLSLTSMLEAQGEDNTIKWCTAMIRLNTKDY